MPALPPKLGQNPTPEEVESYREQLEEFQRALAEKRKSSKGSSQGTKGKRGREHQITSQIRKMETTID